MGIENYLCRDAVNRVSTISSFANFLKSNLKFAEFCFPHLPEPEHEL